MIKFCLEMNADNSFLIAAKYYESFHKGESLLHSPKQYIPGFSKVKTTTADIYFS